MVASLVFLTPLGGLAGIAAALVLAAFLVGGRRAGRVRAALGLQAPPPRWERIHLAALAAVALPIVVAAMQPAWQTSAERRVRTDAQVFVVIDTSRSMLASSGPASATRLERARTVAIAIRAALPQVAVGVGTLTDRVLPNLLPSANERSFDATVRQAIDIEQPPPASTGVTASTLAALAQVPAGGTFAPSAKRRALVVLTDGESRPFDPGSVADALRRAPGTELVLVHVWRAGESIHAADGTAETTYRPDPASEEALASLATAAGGTVVGEHRAAQAAQAIETALGSGPTTAVGTEPRSRSLGWIAALAALVPLGLVLWRRNLP